MDVTAVELEVDVWLEVGRADGRLVMVAELVGETAEILVLVVGVAMLKIEVDEAEDVDGVDEVYEAAFEGSFVVVGRTEELEDVAITQEVVDGVETASGFGALDGVFEAAGAEITTVTGGGLTSIIEYFVAVVVAVGATGVCVIVTKTVCVDLGPSIIFVETTTLVMGGRVTLSVSTIVTGAGLCMIVWTIVAAGDGSLVAAGPPSRATTE